MADFSCHKPLAKLLKGGILNSRIRILIEPVGETDKPRGLFHFVSNGFLRLHFEAVHHVLNFEDLEFVLEAEVVR